MLLSENTQNHSNILSLYSQAKVWCLNAKQYRFKIQSPHLSIRSGQNTEQYLKLRFTKQTGWNSSTVRLDHGGEIGCHRHIWKAICMCVYHSLRLVLINVIMFSLRSPENAAKKIIHLSAADVADNSEDAEVRPVKKHTTDRMLCRRWGLTGVSATVISHRAFPHNANNAAHYNAPVFVTQYIFVLLFPHAAAYSFTLYSIT